MDAEHNESDPKKEDEHKERDRSAERGDEVDGSDTEPDPEVKTDRARFFTRIRRAHGVGAWNVVVSARQTEEGDQDGRVTPPEHAERAEDSGTESVTASKLPKTGKELSQTTVRDGEPKHSSGDFDSLNLNVVERQEKGGS